MLYSVFYSKRSEAQLASIYRYIARKSSQQIAVGYISALREYCDRLDRFPMRGTEITPGVRTVGFRHSATIAFRISTDTVTILAVYYRGRNVRAHL